MNHLTLISVSGNKEDMLPESIIVTDRANGSNLAQIADYMNMMAAPQSKEYPATITREIGKDMVIFKWRSRLYNALYYNEKLDKKSISVYSNMIV